MRNEILAGMLVMSVACSADIGGGSDVDLVDINVMTYNAMTYNAMTYNALSANATANKVMAEVPLSSESYNGGVEELKNQLSDPTGRTQEFFHYLVTCALEPGQRVEYKDEIHGGTFDATYDGQLGLCPDWHTDKPTDQCREVVSSCLLARQNAFGVSVALSMRGHAGSGDWLRTEEDEIKQFPWREGAFFGDVFGHLADGIDVHVDENGELVGDSFQIDDQPMYTNMYACYSDVWTTPEAYLHDRICAGGGVNCVAAQVGDCLGHPTYAPNMNRCATDDDGPEYGEGDYQFCEDHTGSGVIWENALTVWLEEPCAVVSEGNCDVFGEDDNGQ